MARPVKSVEQHKKDGTYQKCRHEKRGMDFSRRTKPFSCPKGYSPDVKKEWRALNNQLVEIGALVEADYLVLKSAFDAYEQALSLDHYIEEQGGAAYYLIGLIPGDKNLVTISEKLKDDFKKVVYKYGVTPVERSKVQGLNKGNSQDDEDEEIFSKVLSFRK